ncbi:tRNA (adenosine(37)-N6)-threonylcarbamoyltransferase complex ATPase subunit type 1 TsaE [Parasphingorhabdus halotolerans]|uniref:tRNA threonylcarbamoyladenosine biosynthesis protein TsaE n=1 Tax=Parasphingorhabdus halotolerans TaxID=2725558 RepID=A0A6H2DIG5_9SPHN|nr:tRNA (adenosine(37)-N6)-threonylcarbamoyltransferase complex ATPase subunit type 1 TsaE [Parasphingorhabdus halotolerans]QJB68124.1 tRNA (adenosine(37)-N6)-threonylcarbamoyltransferase complex ATPase subunit type 1 TsaE [Parasphingorhabdus halotolerans]
MIIDSEKAMLDLGANLADILQIGDKVALSGTLGAGKTTFARGLMRGLGFDEEVPSPTFAIVQQYEPPETRLPVAHVDLYRIEDTGDIRELGLGDALEYGALIAEWPDRMPDGFWDNGLQIKLEIETEKTRRLTWTAGPAWKNRWPIT